MAAAHPRKAARQLNQRRVTREGAVNDAGLASWEGAAPYFKANRSPSASFFVVVIQECGIRGGGKVQQLAVFAASRTLEQCICFFSSS